MVQTTAVQLKFSTDENGKTEKMTYNDAMYLITNATTTNLC